MVSFRGASADAMAALTDQVGGVAEASAATVAGDLFSVAGAFRSEAALRRVVTDQSVPAEARSGLVGDLFTGKVDAATLGLVREAAGRRWTRTRDLADALEQLGVVAAVRSVGLQGATLVDELFGVRQLVTANSDLRNALSDPARSTADKGGLLESPPRWQGAPGDPAAGQAGAVRLRTAPWCAALEDYERTAAQVQGESVATVHVARALSAADEQRLACRTDAAVRPPGAPQHRHRPAGPRRPARGDRR